MLFSFMGDDRIHASTLPKQRKDIRIIFINQTCSVSTSKLYKNFLTTRETKRLELSLLNPLSFLELYPMHVCFALTYFHIPLQLHSYWN